MATYGVNMASIIVVSGNQQGEYLPLGRRISVIGRGESISLQILDDLVSRKHLRIYFNQTTSRYYAENMKSKHGVFINNCRITTETVLFDGDKILIGNTTLLFTENDFNDRESALCHYKKAGERKRETRTDA